MVKAMRKVRTGSVVRTSREKTAVVEMVWKQRHRIYGKQMRRVARFQVHDPENQCRLGDVVRIEETRPISKTKHWRLMEILQRRQVADVAPIELESDAEIVVPEAETAEDAPAAAVEEAAVEEVAAGDSPEDAPSAECAPSAESAPSPESAPSNEAADDETTAVASDESAGDQETLEEDDSPEKGQGDEDGR